MHSRSHRFSPIFLILPLLLLAATACEEILTGIVEAAFDVEGVVVDAATGEPVEGVTVEFVLQAVEDGNTITDTVVTGSDGIFARTHNLGTVTITPSKEGWSFDPAPVTATEEVDDIVIEATDEYATHGRIAYLHDGAMWVMHPDGSNPTHVTDSPFFGSLSWSPDRQRIAFARTGDQINIDLYLIDVDGADEEHWHTENRQTFDPSWSPDGTEIAHTNISYTSSIYGVDVIHVRSVSNGQIARQFETHYDQHASWSPDGTEIAFTSNLYETRERSRGNPTPEVYLRNADGSGTPERLTQGGGARPAWSPDGTRIAYQADGQIHLMNRDGSGQTTLTSGAMPTWSLDGSRIAFVRDGSIWTIAEDGSNEVELREGGSPAWRD